jgi:hypothetical protein
VNAGRNFGVYWVLELLYLSIKNGKNLMKHFPGSRSIIILAVAVVAMAGVAGPARAQPGPPPPAQPVPPPANSALPADIVPGTPLADVVKMVQAGVDAGTILSYIVNCQSAFNLDADKILFLKDEGVPSELINAMLERDKFFYAASVTPVTPPAAPETTVDTGIPDTAPPPEEVTIDYFYDTLSPYGTWVDIGGYGRCWRPTAVIYDQSWQPYGDRGHWVYTDYGWYWDSDYAWGAAFHYGRWFRNPQYGWCWYPDTVWAPSWVTWRSGGDYCGWAPLPPFAVFVPGVGFYYRGVSVGLDFDFGLGADCFLFVTADHFCDRRPGNYFVKPQYVTQIYRQTKVINNYSVSSKTIVNRGIAVDRISSVTHQTIAPVSVSTLPNAGRQGWRGAGYQQTLQRNAGQSYNANYGGRTTVQGSQGNHPAGATYPQHQIQQQPVLQQQPQQRSFQQPSQPSYQQPPQTRPYNGYVEPNRAVSQTPQIGGQQTRSYGSPVESSAPSHGYGQSEGNQSVAPQPREEVHQNNIESAPHNNSPAVSAPAAVPEHNSGGGNGSNKQIP